MTYAESTGQSIQQSFEDYHAKYPEVYEHFIRLAFKAIRSGKDKISAKMIINVIRWEIFIKTKNAPLKDSPPTLFEQGNPDKKEFKINDAYQSRYARLFIKDFPQHADKFEVRSLRS